MVDYNIDIGERVYISGIHKGHEYQHLNHKIGVVKDVIYVDDGFTYECKAEVQIKGESHLVNVFFLFKLNDFDAYIYDDLLEESPYDYAFRLYEVVYKPILVFNDDGLSFLYCRTKNDTVTSFSVTSIN